VNLLYCKLFFLQLITVDPSILKRERDFENVENAHKTVTNGHGKFEPERCNSLERKVEKVHGTVSIHLRYDHNHV
jgi:hypothetical protein